MPASSGCSGCGCLTYDQDWEQAFGVQLCTHCKRDDDLVSKVPLSRLSQPGYTLDHEELLASDGADGHILQGNAKELYLLTDADFKKLGSLSKANPKHKDWTAMRLYLESQVSAKQL